MKYRLERGLWMSMLVQRLFNSNRNDEFNSGAIFFKPFCPKHKIGGLGKSTDNHCRDGESSMLPWQGSLHIVMSSVALAGFLGLATAVHAEDCQPMINDFNAAVDAGDETSAQHEIDKIAVSAECGRYQVAAQRRLAALRLAAAQELMARGRPVEDFEQMLVAAESRQVLWQASATLGEARFGARRFAEAAGAFDRAIEIVKNETLTPTAPSKSEIDQLFERAAQARLLAANDATSSEKFVKTARDQRDGSLGGLYSASIRGIVPHAVPVPITFLYRKTDFTNVGHEAADELVTAVKEQHPTRIVLVGHTDVRGSAQTNMKLSLARARAVATFLHDSGIDTPIETLGKGATEPMHLSDRSGLRQEDIYALDRRVEWLRE
jgi:outer membrane protein OmpA-like peptidoglycan-associated protein